jgi:hypothetical protein
MILSDDPRSPMIVPRRVGGGSSRKEALTSAGKKFIGLDVHQNTIAITVADNGMDREVRYFSTISNRPEALHAALKKISPNGPKLATIMDNAEENVLIYMTSNLASQRRNQATNRGRGASFQTTMPLSKLLIA